MAASENGATTTIVIADEAGDQGDARTRKENLEDREEKSTPSSYLKDSDNRVVDSRGGSGEEDERETDTQGESPALESVDKSTDKLKSTDASRPEVEKEEEEDEAAKKFDAIMKASAKSNSRFLSKARISSPNPDSVNHDEDDDDDDHESSPEAEEERVMKAARLDLLDEADADSNASDNPGSSSEDAMEAHPTKNVYKRSIFKVLAVVVAMETVMWKKYSGLSI